MPARGTEMQVPKSEIFQLFHGRINARSASIGVELSRQISFWLAHADGLAAARLRAHQDMPAEHVAELRWLRYELLVNAAIE